MEAEEARPRKRIRSRERLSAAEGPRFVKRLREASGNQLTLEALPCVTADETALLGEQRQRVRAAKPSVPSDLTAVTRLSGRDIRQRVELRFARFV